jgi:hypothetical protein
LPEDLSDWENVRRQALATLKLANRKTGRAPSDQGEAIRRADEEIARQIAEALVGDPTFLDTVKSVFDGKS